MPYLYADFCKGNGRPYCINSRTVQEMSAPLEFSRKQWFIDNIVMIPGIDLMVVSLCTYPPINLLRVPICLDRDGAISETGTKSSRDHGLEDEVSVGFEEDEATTWLRSWKRDVGGWIFGELWGRPISSSVRLSAHMMMMFNIRC